MRHRHLLAAVFAVFVATAAAAQKPNFSGTWTIVSPERSAGQEQIVKQDDKTLTIIIGGRTMTHQLDGADHRQTIAMRGGEVVMISRAAWEGNTIVITTSTDYPNKMKTVSKEIWSIDDQRRLNIDVTETAEGQPPRVVKAIFTRRG